MATYSFYYLKKSAPSICGFAPPLTPSDSDLLKPTVNRLEEYYGSPASISTDRAFASAKNDEFLEEKNIFNATCPRSP